MPIETRYLLTRLTEEQFKTIDFSVMGAAFETHNTFGRLFSENAYKQEMAERVALNCDLEEAITVSHKGFSKTFLMDLVVDQGLVCELKVSRAITAGHEAQLLQYMLLCEATRGKVINFGAASVEANLVSTTLTRDLRRKLSFCFQAWRDSSIEAQTMKETFIEFIQDIGGFLSLPLYYEDLTCLLGGHEKVVQSIKIHGTSKTIASQKCHLLTPTAAFKITAWTSQSAIDSYRKQLIKFLNHTDLHEICWINLSHQNIAFETVSK